jgi:hypothetical protein
MLCRDYLLVKILLIRVDCSKLTTEVGSISVIDDTSPELIRNIDMTIPMHVKCINRVGRI